MKKIMYLLFLVTIAVNGQSNGVTTNGPTGKKITYYPTLDPIPPCAVNGVNITITGTNENIPYLAPVPTSNVCAISASYSGNGAWTTYSSTGFITYTFSQPILSATITYDAVNSYDSGIITTNAPGAVTLSNLCGLTVSSGNVLNCTYGTYGDVSLTVSSTTSFNTITLTNSGGWSGWVSGNPCNFNVTASIPILNCPKVYMEELCYHATASQTTTNSLFDGDGCDTPATINGVPCTASNTTIVMINPLPFGCFFNPNGTLTYPAGTLPFFSSNNYYYKLRSIANPGNYSLPYRVDFGIKSKINTLLHNIWLSVPLNEHYASGSYNIIVNSQYNPTTTGNCSTFVQATAGFSGANVTITETTSPLNQYYRILGNGSVVNYSTIPDTNVPYSNYELTFTICDVANPTICSEGRLVFSPYYASRMAKDVKDKNLVISPNPSPNGIFNINFGEIVEKATVEIYNTIGQKVYETTIIDTNEQQLILDNVNTGMYLLKITNGDEIIVKQLIK